MKTKWWLCGVTLWFCIVGMAAASEQTAKAEQALDARLGLKGRTFQVNLAALKTRTELREKAQVKTGLPNYDQQVENAQNAPAALMDMLTVPNPAPVRTAPRSDPAPPKEDNNNINNPNCYIGQFNELVCP